jgi:hypothetical protein
MHVSALAFAGAVLLALGGCTQEHRARVRAPVLAPSEKPEVLHTGRLFIDLRGYTADRQCGGPAGYRTLCYERVQEAIARTLSAVLWPSFPSVVERGHADDLAPGDYVLLISANLDTLPPDAHSAGWSTGIRGQYRLVRDGMPVAEAAFESRSRAEFPYGRALGAAAGEVIGAVAEHLGGVLSALPEERAVMPRVLPSVLVKPIAPPAEQPHSLPVAAR